MNAHLYDTWIGSIGRGEYRPEIQIVCEYLGAKRTAPTFANQKYPTCFPFVRFCVSFTYPKYLPLTLLSV